MADDKKRSRTTTQPDAPVWIGLDLGTSGMKAVAVDSAGTVIATGHAPYSTARPTPGASEQQPHDWLRAMRATIAELAAQVPKRRWLGIGLSAMLPTLVTLDADANPLGSAITWEDGRADEDGEWLRAQSGAQALYESTGQWVDGRYLLPMYLGLINREPGRERATHTIAGAKDLLFLWLTGELATDPSTAAGFGAYVVADGSWDKACVDAFRSRIHGPVPRLPSVRPATTIRDLSPAAAATLGLPAGLPVCLGAADSVLGALGLGVEAPGSAAYLAGTSTVIMALTDRWLPDPEHRYLITPTTHEEVYGVEMDLLCTGSAIRWLAALLGRSNEADVVALAGTVRPLDAPTFLPYLAPGEQGALWDATVSGTIDGLHIGHGAADLARGLLNGILLESRRCVAALRDAGIVTNQLRVAGGSASDPRFRQDLADCTGCQVLAADAQTDQSALGAALLTARAVLAANDDGGHAQSLALATSPQNSGQRLTNPTAGSDRLWQALWDRYERLRRQTTADRSETAKEQM